MFRAAGYAVGWVSLLMAAAVLIVARRRTYGLHMLRGVLGVGVFGLSLFLLAQSTHAPRGWAPRTSWCSNRTGSSSKPTTPRWSADRHTSGDHRMDAAVEQYVSGVQGRGVVLANVVSLLSLLVLCWPRPAAAGLRRTSGRIPAHSSRIRRSPPA